MDNFVFETNNINNFIFGTNDINNSNIENKENEVNLNQIKGMEEFNTIINNSDVNRLIIFFYTASWCGPCKSIYPIIKSLHSRAPHISIYKVDVDDDGEYEEDKISVINEIDCMPTFHFYKNKERIFEMSGVDKLKLLENIKLHTIIS